MATVHLGRQSGAAGFSRTVAIKRLHPNLAKDPEFVAMFLDEARLVARIRHPNVVPTIDVVATEGEVFVVMEYVHGESLARLRTAMIETGRVADPRIVASVISGVLHGLHAAHEAKSEVGQPLNIVHRDVSPQNILVGIEGISRVLDFGVAKAIGRVQSTREGQIKGKLAYMSPEQLQGGHVTRQADIYAVAAVTWEAFTGQRLFSGKDTGALVTAILTESISPPSAVSPHVADAFDRVVMRGLERDPARRYSTAREMALDLERCAGIVSPSEVGTWVERWAGPTLSKRAALIAEIEGTRVTQPTERTTIPDPTASDMSMDVALEVPDDALGHADGRSALSHVTASSRARQMAQSKQRIALLAWIVAFGLAAALVSVLAIHNRAEKPVMAEPTTVAGRTHPPTPAASETTLQVETPTVDVASLPEATGAPGGKRAHSGVPATLHPLGPPPAPVSKPSKPDCTTPFVVDDKGHKHYKAACL
jgi:eukaryotic-like serine/threonine-protein kinase